MGYKIKVGGPVEIIQQGGEMAALVKHRICSQNPCRVAHHHLRLQFQGHLRPSSRSCDTLTHAVHVHIDTYVCLHIK